MATFTYPTSVELTEVEAVKLEVLTQNSPAFRFFPFRGARSHLLEWTQRDTYGGMQQIRGLNGEPPRVMPVGEKSYIAKPGVYGEHMALDETELTLRAANVNGGPMNIDDMVTERQDQLLSRRLVRQEWLIWKLLIDGHFAVLAANGTVEHVDGYQQQQFTASVPWGTVATATPMADVRNAGLLFRGQSASGGTGATLLMNSVTASQLLGNTNTADIRPFLMAGSAPTVSTQGVNQIFLQNGLPTIEIYDETYLDESLAVTNFIPNNVAILIARRNSGAPLGEFRYTLNINNPGGTPAPYTRVIDRFDTHIPRDIEVHDGFNGGPVLFYPGSIVKMNV
jgi:hypothetical protein